MSETKKRILFDSNVIIDAITDRPEANQAAKTLFLMAAAGDIEGFLVSKQITDIAYVLRKYVSKEQVRDFAAFLCKSFSILSFTKEHIEKAVPHKGRDFEDDILVIVAEAYSLDGIVTNNVKDFSSDKLFVYKPEKLVKITQTTK